MRKWEVWNEGLVTQIIQNWHDPRNTDKQPNDYHKMLIDKVPDLIVGGSVLDVGCGLGHLYGLLKDKVREYLGIDTSRDMLKKAKTYFSGKKTIFKYGDILNLDKIPAFDTVVAIGVLLHLPQNKVNEALKGMYKKAKMRVIFSVNIGQTTIERKRSMPDKKILIERTDTKTFYYDLFKHLKNVKSIRMIEISNHAIFSNTIFVIDKQQ